MLVHAILGIRIISTFFITLGVWLLAANLCDSYREIDPSYLGYYFCNQMLRPLLAILSGVLLYILSKKIGKKIIKGIE